MFLILTSLTMARNQFNFILLCIWLAFSASLMLSDDVYGLILFVRLNSLNKVNGFAGALDIIDGATLFIKRDYYICI